MAPTLEDLEQRIAALEARFSSDGNLKTDNVPVAELARRMAYSNPQVFDDAIKEK